MEIFKATGFRWKMVEQVADSNVRSCVLELKRKIDEICESKNKDMIEPLVMGSCTT